MTSIMCLINIINAKNWIIDKHQENYTWQWLHFLQYSAWTYEWCDGSMFRRSHFPFWSFDCECECRCCYAVTPLSSSPSVTTIIRYLSCPDMMFPSYLLSYHSQCDQCQASMYRALITCPDSAPNLSYLITKLEATAHLSNFVTIQGKIWDR